MRDKYATPDSHNLHLAGANELLQLSDTDRDPARHSYLVRITPHSVFRATKNRALGAGMGIGIER